MRLISSNLNLKERTIAETANETKNNQNTKDESEEKRNIPHHHSSRAKRGDVKKHQGPIITRVNIIIIMEGTKERLPLRRGTRSSADERRIFLVDWLRCRNRRPRRRRRPQRQFPATDRHSVFRRRNNKTNSGEFLRWQSWNGQKCLPVFLILLEWAKAMKGINVAIPSMRNTIWRRRWRWITCHFWLTGPLSRR